MILANQSLLPLLLLGVIIGKERMMAIVSRLGGMIDRQ
jgi:hypothetical protein